MRLVLDLGAASVIDYDPGDFLAVGPKDIIKAFTPFLESAPGYVVDWIDAVKAERARRRLALRLYKSWKDDKTEPFWGYGYRSYMHLMYYLLDSVRIAMEAAHPRQEWHIGNGVHNTVLNSWDHARWTLGKPRADAYFEFNDERLILKVLNKTKGRGLKKWFKEVRERATARSDPSLPNLEFPRTNRFDGRWLSVLYWPMDLGSPKRVQRVTDRVIKRFGPRGLLKKYI